MTSISYKKLCHIYTYVLYFKYCWFSYTSWNFKVYQKCFINFRVVLSSRNAKSIIFLILLKIN